MIVRIGYVTHMINLMYYEKYNDVDENIDEFLDYISEESINEGKLFAYFESYALSIREYNYLQKKLNLLKVKVRRQLDKYI